MQVLSWLVKYPDRISSAIPIATAARHSPQQIAFNEVGRQAIMADPDWKLGNYYDDAPPARGLSVARMIGHITCMSDKSMYDNEWGYSNRVVGLVRYVSRESFLPKVDRPGLERKQEAEHFQLVL
jgi:homoserine acetyltransferase